MKKLQNKKNLGGGKLIPNGKVLRNKSHSLILLQ